MKAHRYQITTLGSLVAVLLLASGCTPQSTAPNQQGADTTGTAENTVDAGEGGSSVTESRPHGLPPVDRTAEAETLDIQLTPIVGWNGRQSAGPKYPWLNLGVKMQGGAAAEAWQYGGLECRCILDAAGTELAPVQEHFRDYMRLALRESGPADGVEALTSFERPYPPIETVYAFEGSLRLLMGGETTRVHIAAVTSKAGQYSDPVLAAAGMEEIEIQYEPFPNASPPYARISVLTPPGPIAGIGVSSAQGEEYKGVPVSVSFSPNGGNIYGFILQGIPAADDELWIDIASGAEVVQVPFRFENLELPEMP